MYQYRARTRREERRRNRLFVTYYVLGVILLFILMITYFLSNMLYRIDQKNTQSVFTNNS